MALFRDYWHYKANADWFHKQTGIPLEFTAAGVHSNMCVWLFIVFIKEKMSVCVGVFSVWDGSADADLEAQTVGEQTWLTAEMCITYGFLWGPAVLLEREIILTKEHLPHHNLRLEFSCGKSDMGSCSQPWSDQCKSRDDSLCLASAKKKKKELSRIIMYTWINFNLRCKCEIGFLYFHRTNPLCGSSFTSQT